MDEDAVPRFVIKAQAKSVATQTKSGSRSRYRTREKLESQKDVGLLPLPQEFSRRRRGWPHVIPASSAAQKSNKAFDYLFQPRIVCTSLLTRHLVVADRSASNVAIHGHLEA